MKKDDIQFESLTKEEKAFIETRYIADQVLEGVIDKLDIPKEDDMYRAEVFNVLKRKTIEHIVVAILLNLSKGEEKGLENFMEQGFKIDPAAIPANIIMQYALLFPKLMKKVQVSTKKYFEGFIKRYKAIVAA
jgi:hypothetical protein